jgi:predicted acylesterase/phospholipase RssA
MAKTALVVSGGGSKGAFAAGVIKQLAMEFPDIVFDILVGTSTGSLIVPLVALDELDLMEQLYTSVRTQDIITKGNVVTRLMTDNSLFDAKPLANLVKQHYTDARCNKLFALDKEVYLATTCLQSGDAVYFSTKDPAIITDYEVLKAGNPDEFRRAVMASACQPVFMPPIEVKKGSVPLRQYVDGGVREYAGIQLAIDAGADEIFVILLNTGKNEPTEQPFGDAFTILKQSMDIFITDVGDNDIRVPGIYNKALRYIDSVKRKMKDSGVKQADIDNYFNIPFKNPFTGKKALNIHLIRPAEPLGGGPGGLDFEPLQMKGMMAKGKTAISTYMASRPQDGSGNV